MDAPGTFSGARSAYNDWEVLDTQIGQDDMDENDLGIMTDAFDVPYNAAYSAIMRAKREAAGKRAAQARQGDEPSNIPNLQMPEELDQEWIANMKDWMQPVGEDWVFVKILGRGGYGVAGLWEYRGKKRREVTKVVVKQSLAVKELEMEAGIIREIARGNSPHALGIYRDVRYDFEQGCGKVAKIFLEFMEGGDLGAYVEETKKRRPNDGIEEVHAWAIFHCMALGLCVIANGSEDPGAPPREGDMITHFDIKPDNFLRGKFDEHHKIERIVKFADFGLALKMPYEQHYDESNKLTVPAHLRTRGTLNYGSPEAGIEPVSGRLIGTCTNVWGVGATMTDFLSMTPEKWRGGNPWHSELTPDGLMKGGKSLLKTRYSDALKVLVWRCLKLDPPKRIGVNELLRQTQSGLEAALRNHAMLPPVVTDGHHASPLPNWTPDSNPAPIPDIWRVPTPPSPHAVVTNLRSLVRRGVGGLGGIRKPLAGLAERARVLRAKRAAEIKRREAQRRAHADAQLRRYQADVEGHWRRVQGIGHAPAAFGVPAGVAAIDLLRDAREAAMGCGCGCGECGDVDGAHGVRRGNAGHA